MSSTLSLILIALIPISFSVILYCYFNSKFGEKLSQRSQQIIAGIIFGIIAIWGTEFGVPINGAILNARDAAPLCAALIFGVPAGIISGFIGGIERWFAVYWGAGYYTRLACSISTCLTGLIGAGLRKNMFDDKMPSWAHALMIGTVCETIHMLMIFVTNMNDARRAFTYVEACTIPMVTIVSLAVAVAVFLVDLINKKSAIGEKRDKMPTISLQVQKNLFAVVVFSFVITVSFALLLQNQISLNETHELLKLNLVDAVGDVNAQVDDALLQINILVAEELNKDPEADLDELCKKYGIVEINIVDRNGIVASSNEEKNVGFDMSSGEQSEEFMCLLKDKTIYVQDYGPISRDDTVYRKYSGIKYMNGFLQVAYDQEEYYGEMASKLDSISSYRHIGETGQILIIDEKGNIISEGLEGKIVNIDETGADIDFRNSHDYEVYVGDFNDVECYYMIARTQGYYVLGFLPCSEAEFSKNLSTYLTVFMETLIFGSLFVVIYFIMKFLVVRDIRSVNNSLQEITKGNLDTVVDIRTNKEFISLSDGINTTVDKLKQLIGEANARIDTELQYAKEIQMSALPSVFPFEKEYELFALMRPAKDVGGDFYDFYMLDKKTLAFVVADVSGKGIPAALFMMRAKTTMKTYAENKISVGDIFTNANFNLCEGNDAGMFVTAWMGFLNLETGELVYVNAGHNSPLLRKDGGFYEFLEGPKGFVLGGFEGVVYKEQRTVLKPGDSIFLYTDGVVEATNREGKLYGDDRLYICINKHREAYPKELCDLIRDDVDVFYDGAAQFDDMTELCLKFNAYYKPKN